MDYYIGWDVGGWTCDHNRTSRDALCALAGNTWDTLALAGEPWRGNLREALVENNTLNAILAKMSIRLNGDNAEGTTWAIDTPLGWPDAFRSLLADNGNAVDVPEESHLNPCLFRQTERWLAQQGFRPLSAVRDKIGSQSTKGMHFLRRCGFRREAVGTWTASSHKAIETYPRPVRTNATLRRSFERLNNPLWQQDIQDSLWCALVAAMFTLDPTALHSPDGDIPPEEGWIWVPNDINAGHH